MRELRKGWSGFAAAMITVSLLTASASAQSNPAVPSPAGENAAPVPATGQDERVIHLRHHWTRFEVKVAYKVNGVYQPDAIARINHLLRDWRCNKTINIDPKLIDLLYDLHQALGAQGPIRIVSGYRSEGYNASLLRAGRNVDPNSQHMLGRAVDIVIPGIRGAAVRDMATKLNRGGVGYYAYSWPNFVHIDTGPVRRWIENDPKTFSTGRIRQRLKVDCDLTMAEVFTGISREQVLAELPVGASVETVHPRYGATMSGADASPELSDATPLPMMPGAERRPANACMVGESLDPLTRLRRGIRVFETRRARARARMTHHFRRHYRRRHFGRRR